MSKLWDWYDGLAKKDPTLRFMLFMLLVFVSYLIIPAFIAYFFGRQYFLPCTYLGVVVMGALALSKHFRWPK